MRKGTIVINRNDSNRLNWIGVCINEHPLHIRWVFDLKSNKLLKNERQRSFRDLSDNCEREYSEAFARQSLELITNDMLRMLEMQMSAVQYSVLMNAVEKARHEELPMFVVLPGIPVNEIRKVDSNEALKIDGSLVCTDLDSARLFCKTILQRFDSVSVCNIYRGTTANPQLGFIESYPRK
tara:strand:- start:10631 stop:11173 length:543 start_codon:yes stop_codon:yes gene_type:complete